MVIIEKFASLKDFVGDLAKILTECDDEEFTVECLGILGNLALPDLDYSQIIHNFNLIPLVRNMLVPGELMIIHLSGRKLILCWCFQGNIRTTWYSRRSYFWELVPRTNRALCYFVKRT